jgi:hypothetical protein
LGRLVCQYELAQAEVEQLSTIVKEREDALATQRNQLSAELDNLRAALVATEQNAALESEALKTELANLTAEHRQVREEHESTKTLCAALEARQQESAVSRERLLAEQREQLANAQIERQRLIDEVLELRTSEGELTRVTTDLISTAQNYPRVPVASLEELEAARIEAERLQQAIELSKYICRVVAESSDRISVNAMSQG